MCAFDSSFGSEIFSRRVVPEYTTQFFFLKNTRQFPFSSSALYQTSLFPIHPIKPTHPGFGDLTQQSRMSELDAFVGEIGGIPPNVTSVFGSIAMNGDEYVRCNRCGYGGCDVRVSGCGCTMHAVSFFRAWA